MLNCPHCEQELTPHEIGVLYAAVGRTQNSKSRRFWGAKLTQQDVNLIRKSKEATGKIAKKHTVSFHTIWRIRKGRTYKGQNELNCPHCGHEITPKEVSRLFATLGGSRSSPRKAKASAVNGRKARNWPKKMLPISESQTLPRRNLQDNLRFVAVQLFK